MTGPRHRDAVLAALRAVGHGRSDSLERVAEAAAQDSPAGETIPGDRVSAADVAAVAGELGLDVVDGRVTVDLLALPVPGDDPAAWPPAAVRDRPTFDPVFAFAASEESNAGLQGGPVAMEGAAGSVEPFDGLLLDPWEAAAAAAEHAAAARESGDLLAAIDAAERSRDAAADADADTLAAAELRLGSLLEEHAENGRALDAYRRAANTASGELASFAWRLVAELLRSRDPAASEVAYRRAAELGADPDEQALALTRLATLVAGQGRSDPARAALTAAANAAVDPALRADINYLLAGAAQPSEGAPHGGYSGRQAAEIVGVTYRQLDYWARTDLIRPSIVDASGSRSRRRYSYRDLLELKAVKNLLDAGIRLESVRDAFAYLREHLGEDVASLNLVISGHHWVLVRTAEEIIDLLRLGHGVLNILPLAGVKEEVDAALNSGTGFSAPELNPLDGPNDTAGLSDTAGDAVAERLLRRVG